mgnify:CR=1 FL=1
MSFTPDQIAALEAPLDRKNVKQREQGRSQVSYIEGYHAENEANRIFGFHAWDRETVDIRQVAEKPRKIGKGQYEKDGWGVSYIAKVRITVMTPSGHEVVREGVGAGHGIDADLGQAHESAIKEAETDAEKRALKTFGNPFGQALYDKSQSQVADSMSAAADFAIATMRTSRDLSELVEFWTKNAKGLRADLRPFEFEAVEKAKDAEKARLSQIPAETPFDRKEAA